MRPTRMDLSELIRFSSLDELMVLRDGARAASIEGLMLKRGDSAYVPGRVKGLWWKWKRDPLTVDAVLMYASAATASAAATIPTIRSAFGAGTNSCRWARRISASPTRSWCFSIAGSAITRWRASARCGRSRRRWCWKWRLTRRSFQPPQIRRGDAVPAHRTHPRGQAGGGGGSAGEPDGAGGEQAGRDGAGWVDAEASEQGKFDAETLRRREGRREA